MTTTILCAGALARPHAATVDPAAATAVALPASLIDGTLARAMRRARVSARHRQSAPVPDELPEEAWLRERFGLEGPVAACALPPDDPGGTGVLVRPVHLHLALDHLVLAPPARLDIAHDEAHALAGCADTLLADEGLRIRVVTPDAWLLDARDAAGGTADVEAIAALPARSARLAAGRDVDAYLPGGVAARRWRQLANLVQMGWFEHPVNATREAAGRLPVNALWLEGRAGRVTRRPFARVVCDDPALAGLARRAGVDTRSIEPAEALDPRAWLGRDERGDSPGSGEPPGGVLLAPGFWREAVGDGDLQGWEEAWLAFDCWFGALLDAAPDLCGRPLRVVLTGERGRVELLRSPADRWRPWRRLRLALLLREAEWA